MSLQNSIVSGNTTADCVENVGTSLFSLRSLGNNIFGQNDNAGTCPVGATDLVPAGGVATVLNTALADNGGPTDTHALVTGSPALDKIPNGSSRCDTGGADDITQDQRGASRPQPADGSCDAGAYEETGGAFFADTDGDGVLDNDDNCPFNSSSSQTDSDGNSRGDACDPGATAACGGVASCTDNDSDGFGSPGAASCSAGSATDCNDADAAINPGAAEVCDGVDNDCSGVSDDNIAPVATACGVGECASAGLLSCASGGLVDSCAPGPASDEVCDGFDNDCDGVIDDNIADIFAESDVGECRSEIQSCIGGTFNIVQTAIGPATEVCDGLDNDCNAVVDDTEVLEIFANRHTVGWGSHPGSTKEPFVDIEVCAYDKSDGSCSRVTCGGISHQNYQCIVDSCGTDDDEQIFCCTTDDFGECVINAPPGDYIVISAEATKTVLPDPLGVSASDLVCGELKQKHLQQIVKADGKKVPGKTSRRKGSELLVIEPEFIEWSGQQELYPFVFEAVGDWEVSTAVAPPEGFVSDYDALAEQVVNEVEAVQFTITDIGSDWVPTEAKHTVSHGGRRQVILSRVGVRLTSDLAQQKGLDRSGHVLGQNGKPVSQAAGFDPQAPPECEIVGWIEPSPTDANWTVMLQVNVSTDLTLQITRGQGLVVETLANETLDAGEYEFTFDGGSLGRGRHFVTLVCGETVQSVFLVEK